MCSDLFCLFVFVFRFFFVVSAFALEIATIFRRQSSAIEGGDAAACRRHRYCFLNSNFVVCVTQTAMFNSNGSIPDTAENKMNAENISIVFAPSVFSPDDQVCYIYRYIYIYRFFVFDALACQSIVVIIVFFF